MLSVVVLSRTPWDSAASPPDGALPLLVAAVVGPNSARYRQVEQFGLRRVGDGARFDTRVLALEGEVPSTFGQIELPRFANVLLPRSGQGALLGRDDLAAGAYDLAVTSEGVELHGRATVPETPAPRITTEGGRLVVRWPRAVGAAGYQLRADTERATVLLTDTAYVLTDVAPSELPPSPKVRLAALDSNYFAYLRSDGIRRAGLDAGLGVFGGFSGAEISIPVR